MGFFDLFHFGRFARFGHINLDKIAELHGVNHRLSIEQQKALVERAHNQFGLDASYGGWMEHRGHLWQGTYLEEKSTWVHLGVDVNVPEGTIVYCPWHARVLAIKKDRDKDGGWGTRVILQRESKADGPDVLIFGHLTNIRPAIKVGVEIYPKYVLGEVGTPENNGGWYPHLHVQMVSAQAIDTLAEFAKVEWLLEQDGYGQIHRIAELARIFPDPVSMI